MDQWGEIIGKKSAWLLLLLVAGILFGMGIILFKFNATLESIRFTQTPSFAIWLLAMSVLMGLVPVAGIPLWGSLRPYREQWNQQKMNIVASSLLLYGMIIAPIPFVILFTKIDFPLYLHIPKMAIIFTLTYLAVLAGAVGLWLISAAAQQAYQTLTTDLDNIYPYIEAHKTYRDNLQVYLTFGGLMISLVVLSTGALRNALIEYDPANAVNFSTNMVLAYGIYFSFILALIYIPTFTVLQMNGRKLRERLYPIHSLEDHAALEEKRKKFDALMGLNIGVSENLRSGLFILAPMLASLFSSIVGY